MKKVGVIFTIAIAIFCFFITGCENTATTPTSESSYQNTDVVVYSKSEINKAAICWLGLFNAKYGDWVGDGQCTAVARKFTIAPGYGKDNGGIDYIKLQDSKGTPIPKLIDYKNEVKPCDNLILVGSGYADAGHTAVVFYVDNNDDNIYYLDQNYNHEGLTLRQRKISEIENIAYVISSTCKKTIDFSNTSCANANLADDIPIESLDIKPDDDSTNSNILNNHRFAFVGSDGNLWVVSEDGSNLQNLSKSINIGDGIMGFDWSPDGKSIALIANKSLYIISTEINASEQTTAIIIKDGTIPQAYVNWSSDGKYIAFQGINSGLNCTIFNSQNIDTPNIFRILATNNEGYTYTVYKSTECSAVESNPVFSPDGKRIVFFDQEIEDNNSGKTILESTFPELDVKEKIFDDEVDFYTYNPLVNDLTLDFANEINPRWSPDGTKLLVNALQDGENIILMVNANISYVDSIGLESNYSVIYDDAWTYDWSPNGNKIIFSRSAGGMFTVNPDGTNLSDLRVNGSFPRWSPDNKVIAYFDVNDSNLYFMDIYGTNIIRVAKAKVLPYKVTDMAEWSPK